MYFIYNNIFIFENSMCVYNVFWLLPLWLPAIHPHKPHLTHLFPNFMSTFQIFFTVFTHSFIYLLAYFSPLGWISSAHMWMCVDSSNGIGSQLVTTILKKYPKEIPLVYITVNTTS